MCEYECLSISMPWGYLKTQRGEFDLNVDFQTQFQDNISQRLWGLWV
ncbi:hypothetical protein RKLH11_4197 [Rhodobacteraceae bacterium KLH11]|nr:hypothetical protein RKLH11_4197 [Rhodobacteraceae bacterium KLH11]